MSGLTRRNLLAGVLLFAATFASYVPAMRAGFIWDDDECVVHNPTLRDWNGLRRIWFEFGAVSQYYPLTHTTFWVQYRIWGPRPLPYHVANVLFHAANALLLWIVLRRLAVPAAWFAAAAFALHPVQVESVAWITERKNVLYAFFYLLSALCALAAGWCDPEEDSTRAGTRKGATRDPCRRHRALAYGASLLFFAAAMLSKTVACSLPAALLVVSWWKRGRIGARNLVPLIPMFLVGLGLGLTTAWMEKHLVGASGASWTLSLLDRCLIAGRALWFYAGKLAWPARLTFIYPRWTIDSRAAWQFLPPLSALCAAAGLWLARGRIGRGPLAAALFFAGTLFPALGFFDVFPMQYSFVADHFQYLASVGPIALVAGVIGSWLDRSPRAKRRAGIALGVAILAALGARTWQQGHVYKDLETLWRDTVKKDPASWMAHNNLGAVLLGEERFDEALVHFEAYLALKPGDALAHNNVAYVLAILGRSDEAEVRFVEALRVDPNLEKAHVNLANLLVRRGRCGEAIAHYREAIRTSPGWPAPLRRLAWLLATHPDPKLRNAEEAVGLARRLIERGGGRQAITLDVVAAAHASAGDFDTAVRAARMALELAHASGKAHLAEEISARLQTYQARLPFRSDPFAFPEDR